VPPPVLRAADDVLIRVHVAGICRTDVYAAEGRLPVREPLILGHEFAGVVEASGPQVCHVAPGQRVAVMPFIACRCCEQCRSGLELVCQHKSMLGVDRDGAFAELVVVPAAEVYPIPPSVSFHEAAYAEPLAAALAVLHAGLRRDQHGLIVGHNRFALLLGKVLRAHGFDHFMIYDPVEDAVPAENSLDFAIETVATTEALATMVRAVRPRGTVVLKSRQPRSVGLNLAAAVAKDLTFRAVFSGPFAEAVALLADRRLDLGDLRGPTYPLESFADALLAAKEDEGSKWFLKPEEDGCAV
jgi:L-iditol 2-dehydrogenase